MKRIYRWIAVLLIVTMSITSTLSDSSASYASGTSVVNANQDETLMKQDNNSIIEAFKNEQGIGGINTSSFVGSPTNKLAAKSNLLLEGVLTSSVSKELLSNIGSIAKSLPAVAVSQSLQEMIHFGEDGVSVSTGNFSKTMVDLSYAFAGFTVNMSRTYNSKDQPGGRFGLGWTFGFEGSLTDDGKLVVVKLPNGGAQMFQNLGNGTYGANDSHSKLVKQNDGTFVFTTKDQYSYGFNKNQWISWMADANGNKITIDVDSLGKVKKITDAVGRVTTVGYNVNDRIVSITDPMNRIVRYEYNAANLLSKVIDPSGQIISYYEYDPSGLLISIKNSKQEVQNSVAYDAKKKVIRHINAWGNIDTYNYGDLYTKITNTEGHVTEKWFDKAFYVVKSKDPDGGITTITYNLDSEKFNQYGEIETITDPYGNKWNYTYDENGNITSITEPSGGISGYSYNEKNNLISEKDPSGNITLYIYDSSGIRLLKKMEALDKEKIETPDHFSITEYNYYVSSEMDQLGYKINGLLKSEVNPEGNATTYTYDKYGYLSSIIDPEGNKTIKKSNQLGWETATISPLGHRTDNTYDSNGRLLRVMGPAGDVTRYIYNADGQKIQEIEPQLYTEESDGLNAANPSNSYADTLGGTRYTYDAGGKVKTQVDPKGNVTEFKYDRNGNQVTKVLPNGAIYEYEYDTLNRVKQESFRAYNKASTVLLKKYDYPLSTDGRKKEMVTSYVNETEQAVTTTVRDFADRIVEKVDPDGGVTTTDYNPDGTVNSVTDAMGFTAYYKYDGLGREIGKWQPIENGKYMYTGQIYDLASNVVEKHFGRDQISQFKVPVDDRLAKNKFIYDKNGRVTIETDSAGLKRVMTYNKDGFKASESLYTSDKSVNMTEYVSNPYGKTLKKMVHATAGELSDYPVTDKRIVKLTTLYSYDLNGNLIQEIMPDGRLTNYSYDLLNHQTSIFKQGLNENNLPVMITRTKQYDWNGNVLSETDERGGTSVNEYDERGLLIKQTDALGNVQLFDYDRSGRKTIQVMPINVLPSRNLTEMNRTEFLYDLSGRVKLQTEIFQEQILNTATGVFTPTNVSRVVKAYQYDLKGNVVKELSGEGYLAGTGKNPNEKIRSGYGTISTYNANGQISMKLDPTGQLHNNKYTTKYDYDGLGRLIRETDIDGIINSTYYDDAGRVTSKTVRKAADDIELTLESSTYDKAGRQLTKVDGNGNVERYEYNAFNKVRRVIYPSDKSVEEWKIEFQYDVMGNQTKKWDNLGRTDLHTYDQEGRELSHTIKTDKPGSSITTRTAYDVKGNKRFEIDANGNKTEYTYDLLDRKISKKTQVSGVSGFSQSALITKTTTYEYDKNSNKTRETDWLGNKTTYDYDTLSRHYQTKNADSIVIEKRAYNGDNSQVVSMDALNQVTQYEYDRNQRKTTTTDGEGYISREEFNDAGLLVAKIDGKGNRTEFTYDAADQLIRVRNALGENTEYSYDLSGNMISQVDGAGNLSLFEYNARNKMSRRIDPDGVTEDPKGILVYNDSKLESYTYFADGSMKSKNDRNGNTTNYAYDFRGLLLSESILKPGELSPTKENQVTYTYDPNGNELSMTDASGRTSKSYDEENRVTSKYVSGLGTVSYAYDKTASLTTGYLAEMLTDVKGNTTEKQYDRLGRLYRVLSNKVVTATYDYYTNGNRKTLTTPGSLTTQYSYYKNNLLKKLDNLRNGSVQDSYSYTYD
ncbi:DUF6531 domain-containing protein, partial [Paenibacillus sp. GCM10012307]